MISVLLTAATSIVIVIVSYAKTWAKLETLIDNLNSSVDKLSDVVSKLSLELTAVLQRISKIEAKCEGLDNRIHLLENQERR